MENLGVDENNQQDFIEHLDVPGAKNQDFPQDFLCNLGSWLNTLVVKKHS